MLVRRKGVIASNEGIINFCDELLVGIADR